jgi:predicted nucleotidyltransferase
VNFGLPDNTLAQIQGCLARYPNIAWVKVYGSRAMGTYAPGSDIDLAFSAPVDCNLRLAADLSDLPTPYLFDVTHYESVENVALKTHIEQMGHQYLHLSPEQPYLESKKVNTGE